MQFVELEAGFMSSTWRPLFCLQLLPLHVRFRNKLLMYLLKRACGSQELNCGISLLQFVYIPQQKNCLLPSILVSIATNCAKNSTQTRYNVRLLISHFWQLLPARRRWFFRCLPSTFLIRVQQWRQIVRQEAPRATAGAACGLYLHFDEVLNPDY